MRNAVTGKALGEPMKVQSGVISAWFSADGRHLLTASYAHLARWDATTGKMLGEPIAHEHWARSVQFSPDGQRVLTTPDDRTAQVWEAATGKALGEPMKHADTVQSAQFSADGQRILTASDDSTAQVWEVATGKALGEPIGNPMKRGGLTWSAEFSPDGQRILIASGDKTARLLDAPVTCSGDSTETVLLLADLAETFAESAFATTGQTEMLTWLEPMRGLQARERIAGKFADASKPLTPLQRFLRWSVADRRSRTISPLSDLTVSEWIENRIKAEPGAPAAKPIS